MSYPNEWPLNLSDDTFNALKTDFNAVLRKTLSNMESKESEAAELTVKLKISLKKEKAPFGEKTPREIVVPKFDHKVSSVMQIKDELTGTLGGNYELVWDKERGEYVMREIVDGQQSIFDAEYEVVEPDAPHGEAETESGGGQMPPALSAGQPLMLPENKEVSMEAMAFAYWLKNRKSVNGGDIPEEATLPILRQWMSCRDSFPDCKCLTCKRFSDVCCSEHARDCKDTTDCIDYEAREDDSGYEYEEPGMEDSDE